MAAVTTTGMFERRELTRVLPVHSKHLQRNIQSSLLSQIKAQVEGRCGVEGYVQPRSSVILEYSLGRMSILKSGVNYRVKFQADICLPHKGQQIAGAPVMFRSKIGVHAEVSPLKILLPRDLHIGNEEFEAIAENDTLDIEVLGAEFKQNDESIFVLGKLLKRTPSSAAAAADAASPAIEVPTMEGSAASAGAGAGAGAGSSSGEEVKSVVFKQPSEGELSAAAVPGPRRRKKLLKPSTTAVITEDGALEAAP
jgi:DNA-directed RNA polymerase subunit E'/Rpb7